MNIKFSQTIRFYWRIRWLSLNPVSVRFIKKKVKIKKGKKAKLKLKLSGATKAIFKLKNKKMKKILKIAKKKAKMVVVKAKKKGKAIVIATAGGKKAKCKVIVK